MKKLKTLDQYNGERLKVFSAINALNSPHPNGIACPKCGSELWDSNPMQTLTSNPPQKNVHCSNCEYTGYRLA